MLTGRGSFWRKLAVDRLLVEVFIQSRNAPIHYRAYEAGGKLEQLTRSETSAEHVLVHEAALKADNFAISIVTVGQQLEDRRDDLQVFVSRL